MKLVLTLFRYILPQFCDVEFPTLFTTHTADARVGEMGAELTP